MRLSDLELVFIDAINDLASFKQSISHICQSYLEQHPEGDKTKKSPRFFDKKITLYKAKHSSQEAAQKLLDTIENIQTDDQLQDFLAKSRMSVAGGGCGHGYFAYYIDRAQYFLGMNNPIFAQDRDEALANDIRAGGF